MLRLVVALPPAGELYADARVRGWYRRRAAVMMSLRMSTESTEKSQQRVLSRVTGEMEAPLGSERREQIRRTAAMTVDERIKLLDRLCREMTHIALSARRVR